MSWHPEQKRDMPWKKTCDPYKIWVSEIILQQTRVEYGKKYYDRIINKFPTVQHLAKATEDEILSEWQGLGYYSRARNMQVAARQIVTKFNGTFPIHYRDILSLKGVGEYTAAAIASFAYNLPYAVVDGNVYRVLSRYFGIETPIDISEGKKLFNKLAMDCLSKENPGTFNQTIMDFGATHCKIRLPLCGTCPLSQSCVAYKKKITNDLPVKSKKIKIKQRYFNYLVFYRNDRIYMIKRSGNDIWKGLYELPLIESEGPNSLSEFHQILSRSNISKSIHEKDIKELGKRTQRLTHQLIHGCFYLIYGDILLETGDWKTVRQLEKLGMPKIIDDFIQDFNSEINKPS